MSPLNGDYIIVMYMSIFRLDCNQEYRSNVGVATDILPLPQAKSSVD